MELMPCIARQVSLSFSRSTRLDSTMPHEGVKPPNRSRRRGKGLSGNRTGLPSGQKVQGSSTISTIALGAATGHPQYSPIPLRDAHCIESSVSNVLAAYCNSEHVSKGKPSMLKSRSGSDTTSLLSRQREQGCFSTCIRKLDDEDELVVVGSGWVHPQ